MCGIAGCINVSLPKNQVVNFIRQALLANALRGTDGAGIFVVDKNKTLYIFKKPLAGPDFIQLAKTNYVITTEDARFIVTHNRSGTNGNHNALLHTHPVEYEHIVLVHNGTLTTVSNLDVSSFTHDSSAIVESIAKHGAKDTLEKLNGSFALVWYDIKENTINMARNSDRPLFLANIKDGKGLLFASESGMLSWLANRNEIKLNSVFSLKEYTWLKIPFDMKEKHETIKFVAYKPKTYNNSGSSYYTIVEKDEEFIGRYLGDVTFSNKEKFHKFTHRGDQVYGWIVPLTEDNKYDFKVGTMYKLKATESRTWTADASNKKCECLGEAQIQLPVIGLLNNPANTDLRDVMDQYKDESSITFEINDMAEAKNENEWNIVGTTADSNEFTVRGFACREELVDTKDEYYTARVRTVIKSPKTGEIYILIYPDTIKGFTYNSNHPGEVNCGWCDNELNPKELSQNKCPELGESVFLCDNCMPYRNQTLGPEREL